jgi:hypothetical protein
MRSKIVGGFVEKIHYWYASWLLKLSDRGHFDINPQELNMK